MPPAKSHKNAPVPHDWLAPEAMVEVTMEDPGLVGSRYPARVLQVRAGKALVDAYNEPSSVPADIRDDVQRIVDELKVDGEWDAWKLANRLLSATPWT